MEDVRRENEQALLSKREHVMVELEKLKIRVDEFEHMGDLDMMQMYVNDSNKIHKQLQQLQESIATINNVRLQKKNLCFIMIIKNVLFL